MYKKSAADIQQNLKIQQDLLDNLHKHHLRTKKAADIAIESARVDLDGKKSYYKLRRNWAWFIGIINALVVVVIYIVITLVGFGYMKFSDYVLAGLIAAGTLENGLAFYVTRFLFPKDKVIV